MRAVTYARISTEMQSETSLAEQTRRARQYAETRDYELVESFQDTGTGMSTNRTGFEEMMSRIDEWDIVISYKLDRFHRSSTNALQWATDLNATGKNFAAMDIDVDTSTAMGMAIFKIITALNEMEVQVTRERTVMGIKAKQNAGKHVGRPPYGYRSSFDRTGKDEDKGILEIHEQEADVVRVLFSLSDKGHSLSEMAESLTESGLLTQKGKLRWSIPTINNILSRRTFYEGYYLDGDNELREHEWISILDSKPWDGEEVGVPL